MKKTKSKARKISIKVNEENYKRRIIKDIFKFFDSMQNKYKDETGYVEYLAFSCVIGFLIQAFGKKDVKAMFKERIEL